MAKKVGLKTPQQTPGSDLPPINPWFRRLMVCHLVDRCSSGFDTVGYGSSDHPGFDDVVTAAFLDAEEHGLIRVGDHQGVPSSHVIYDLTEDGRFRVDLPDVSGWRDAIGVSPSGHLPKAGDRAMWLWLLRNGGVVSRHGVNPECDNGNFLHVALCGLDFDASSSVTDDTWTVFNGTFAEDDTEKGVGGQAACRCGEVGHNKYASFRGQRSDHTSDRPEFGSLHVVAQINSYVGLIKAMMS